MATNHSPPLVPAGPLLLPVQLIPRRNARSKQRFYRLSKPKVRSGCLTCKTRRVKCDEGKPACARCIRGDFVCDGYETQPTKLEIVPVPSAQVVPVKFLPLAPSTLPGLDGHSVPYLDAFRYHVAPELSGSFYMDFCEGTILTGVHQDDSIRQLVLALGALTLAIADDARDSKQSTAQSKPSPLKVWGPSSVKNRNHAASLKHYLKGVQGLRERLKLDPAHVSVRTMTVMTILMALFEILQGNHRSVDSILKSVTALLNEHLAHQRSTEGSKDEITSVQHTFLCFSMMCQYSRQIISAIPIYMQINTVSATEPPVFGVDLPKSLLGRWRLFNSAMMAYIGQAHDVVALKDPEIIKSFHLRGRILYKQALSWREVIRAYLKSDLDEDHLHRLKLLEIHCIISEIHLDCILIPCDLSYDRYEETFKALLDDCTAWLKQQVRNGVPRHITLGEGILLPLSGIARLCRVHDVRMEALYLTQSVTWQEGAWDPQFLALGELGTVVMEERGREESGFIPASSRWLWVSNVDGEKEDADPLGLYISRFLDENGQPLVRVIPYDSAWWDETLSVSMPWYCPYVRGRQLQRFRMDHPRLLRTLNERDWFWTDGICGAKGLQQSEERYPSHWVIKRKYRYKALVLWRKHMAKRHPYKGTVKEGPSTRRHQSQRIRRRVNAGQVRVQRKWDEDEDEEMTPSVDQVTEIQNNYDSNSEREDVDYGKSDSE
ncbi:transcriptional regulatory [Fusarium denticulatum]|uniref:Transcriptional regulatory n=1 Tax=Fusarium denticulatum TaxID=48507 RepID=A0A8H5WVN5_9HYPO|nr:transcriptional regulatory [Fusarium denticulatum]